MTNAPKPRVADRLTAAQAGLEHLDAAIATTRVERGTSLAAGGCTTRVDRTLRELRERRETTEDLLRGLESLLPAEQHTELLAACETAIAERARLKVELDGADAEMLAAQKAYAILGEERARLYSLWDAASARAQNRQRALAAHKSEHPTLHEADHETTKTDG